MFWDFLMFYPIFLLPQVKRSVIISNKHGIYEFGSNILWKIVGRIDVEIDMIILLQSVNSISLAFLKYIVLQGETK